jgi:hypothetical protein
LARKYDDYLSHNAYFTDLMAVLAVYCELLSRLDFPANREKYRENIEFDQQIGLPVPLDL